MKKKLFKIHPMTTLITRDLMINSQQISIVYFFSSSFLCVLCEIVFYDYYLFGSDLSSLRKISKNEFQYLPWNDKYEKQESFIFPETLLISHWARASASFSFKP